jgi:hypothetical protein
MAPAQSNKQANQEKKTFRMQNVQVMLMSGIRQAGRHRSQPAVHTNGVYMRTKQPALITFID